MRGDPNDPNPKPVSIDLSRDDERRGTTSSNGMQEH